MIYKFIFDDNLKPRFKWPSLTVFVAIPVYDSLVSGIDQEVSELECVGSNQFLPATYESARRREFMPMYLAITIS